MHSVPPENMLTNKIEPHFNWKDVTTVLLDMDGTLLDKHFDDYFWEQYVPEHYSLLHNISIEEARGRLLATYKKVENTLAWTDLNHWSQELGLDIPDLKMRVDHLIDIHPYVLDFLEFCKEKGKKLFLVTNAHSKTLQIKLQKTAIGSWFDRIVCSEEVGLPKEVPEFWNRLEEMLDYSPGTTMLADDTEKVLASAAQYGMGYLVYVAKPSSKKEVAYSSNFPSIVYFNELMG